MPELNFRNGYFYGVCLICVVLFIFAIVSLGDTIVDIIYPHQYIEPDIYLEKELRYEKDFPELSKEEIKEMIKEKNEERKAQEEYNRKRRIVLSLTKSILLLLLVIPIYLFHWNRIEGNSQN